MPSSDPDATLSISMLTLERQLPRLLALTILWHPDTARIGEQFLAGPGIMHIAVDRFAPLFSRPMQEPRPLGDRHIARESVQLSCNSAAGLDVRAPNSRMPVILDGIPLTASLPSSGGCINAGVVLQLGGTILLCVHWAHGAPQPDREGELIGVSGAMRGVRDQIRQVAATDLPVLLLGESGTGKELAARAIHAASSRAKSPMVAVNMAVLNEALAAADLFGAVKGAYTGADRGRQGMFAEAAGGTLFLDEIGNAPGSVQPMLLRVLDDGFYRPLGAGHDVQSSARLVAATDQVLDAGRFNQPLLRRLEGFVIRLSALRERREDIGLLIAHLSRMGCSGGEVPAVLPVALVDEMCRYDWPGNVRQLRNVVKRALLALQSGQTPSLSTLIPSAAPAAQVTAALPAAPARQSGSAAVDDNAVLAALDGSGWHIRAAAEALGISRPFMYKLIGAHPLIRPAQAIATDELREAVASSHGDVERCAMVLRTPAEALRRHLRSQGLIA